MFTTHQNEVRKQAYIGRQLKARGPHVGITGILQETFHIGPDMVRHFVTLIGVGGLVLLAAGATTDCTMYWRVLNWVTSFFA